MITETIYACKDPQIGPHNQCAHPVALPLGTRQCRGDFACPVRLPAGFTGATCPGHDEAQAIKADQAGWILDLMKPGIPG